MTWLNLFDRVSWREFVKVDAVFLAAVISILALGMVMVSSASISISESIHGHPYFFMRRQLLYLVLGLAFG